MILVALVEGVTLGPLSMEITFHVNGLLFDMTLTKMMMISQR